MPKFNLKKARNRKKRPIDTLREIDPTLRYSDLDLEDDEIQYLADSMASSKAKKTKVAVHGRGDNWTEVGTGFNPYSTSPLVNPPASGIGGRRWRENFPGGGDHHINDDQDKKKNTKGRATDEAFDPELRKKKINDKLDRARQEEHGGGYIVRVELGPEEFGTEEMAREIFGEAGEFDDDSIWVEVPTFEEAVRLERKQKEEAEHNKVCIEPKHDKEEEE